MPFDEEDLGPHDECRHEIESLRDELATSKSMLETHLRESGKRIDELQTGLRAAITRADNAIEEIEPLRAKLRAAKSGIAGLQSENRRQLGEIKSLRNESADLKYDLECARAVAKSRKTKLVASEAIIAEVSTRLAKDCMKRDDTCVHCYSLDTEPHLENCWVDELLTLLKAADGAGRVRSMDELKINKEKSE